MSIKEELKKLREKEAQLENEIKKENDKKESEMMNLQQIEQRLIQFEGKKSELAKKIYEEFNQNKKESKDNLKGIEEKIEKCKNEYTSIKGRIDELCFDTSLYIKEQVNYLILELTSYIEKNETKLGKKIINEFSIKSHTNYVDIVINHYYVPTGCFKMEDQDYNIVATTKDYYFNNEIVVGYTDCECELSDWYRKYVNDFMNYFFECLNKDFYSENFKVVHVDKSGGKFTIELI